MPTLEPVCVLGTWRLLYCLGKRVSRVDVYSLLSKEFLPCNDLGKDLIWILCCSVRVASPKFNKLKKGGSLKTLDSKPGVYFNRNLVTLQWLSGSIINVTPNTLTCYVASWHLEYL